MHDPRWQWNLATTFDWQMHVFSSFDDLCKSCCFHHESLVCRHVSLLLPFKSCTLKMEPKISDPRPKKEKVSELRLLQMPIPPSLQTSLCMTCICQFFQRLVGSSTSWQWPWNWIVGLAGDQKNRPIFFTSQPPTASTAPCGLRTQPPYSPEGANQMAGPSSPQAGMPRGRISENFIASMINEWNGVLFLQNWLTYAYGRSEVW